MDEPTGLTATATQHDHEHHDDGNLCSQLVLVLNGHDPMEPSVRVLLPHFHEVLIGRGLEQDFKIEESGGKRVLRVTVHDGWASSRHVRLSRVASLWTCEDLKSKNGTLLDGQPITKATLTNGCLLEIGHHLFIFRTAPIQDVREIVSDDKLTPPTPELATFDGELEAAFMALRDVAQRAVPVLIQGASGTGKEVVTRALHRLSGRTGQLVAINSAALPEGLLSSELFGHRKGAFSGANDDRLGHVRAAQGGTLFLDEFGDLPAAAQAALLRVLQELEVVPLGTSKPVTLDLRLAAATHRDLDQLIATGAFRADLLARLKGFILKLPRLEERKVDLGLLIRAIVRRMPDPPSALSFTPVAARALFRHKWPLNIRELELTLRAAVALAKDAPIREEHLPEDVRKALHSVETAPALRPARPPAKPPKEQLHGDDPELLKALLKKHHGNIAAVGVELDKARVQIRRWLTKYGIDPNDFRPARRGGNDGK
jgi:DNA-binding NtrC family response regulator